MLAWAVARAQWVRLWQWGWGGGAVGKTMAVGLGGRGAVGKTVAVGLGEGGGCRGRSG